MPWLDYCNAMIAELPDNQVSRLQSVLNAAAMLVFSARKYKAISPLLCGLQWLRVPQWIKFKLAVLMYRCLLSMTSPYLTDKLHRVVDIDSRRRLRSASTLTLIVALMRHSIIGDRALPVTVSSVWNSLLSSATLSTSLTAFRRFLKSELFLQCFGPDCV